MHLTSCSLSILVAIMNKPFTFSDCPLSSWLTHVWSNPPTVTFFSCPVQFSHLNPVCFGPLHVPSSFLQLQGTLELQLPHWSSCSELLVRVFHLFLHIVFWLFGSLQLTAFLTSVFFLSQTSLFCSSFWDSCCLSVFHLEWPFSLIVLFLLRAFFHILCEPFLLLEEVIL